MSTQILPIIYEIQNQIVDSNYKCKICLRDYIYKSGLQKHTRLKHQNDPTKLWKHICSFIECNFASYHKSSLDKHIKSKSHNKIAELKKIQLNEC